ncbi:benzoylformate decarboxylase [Nocardia arthritidis]|uniref:acetolactate synthase n=1 Tax=Nocardia arthritidis TaxID=228602 RepID=A0A6G9YL12_9NOCA|nr:benzoylformate decarboxylase [Nocardia arthritidis]QIS13995.1 benzoylformate decarboxylase [Nocardia arthritidis]
MTTVREVSYDVLRAFGATTIVGNPGSNELTFLDRMPEDFTFVLALQEGAVISIADGYAQASNTPVVVTLHAAAGLGTGMGALTNAYANGAPLIIIAGQQFRPMLTLEAMLTNREAVTLPKPLVKWSFEAPSAESVPAVLARAAACALTAPTGPVCVSIPLDDWRREADAATAAYSIGRRISGNPHAARTDLEELARRLQSARNPLLVLGPDVDKYGGWHAAITLAEKLSIEVFLGSGEYSRMPFPTGHPCFRGALGATVEQVRDQLRGYDFIAWIGGALLPYHGWDEGPYLAAGTDLIHLTADPDQAARAPLGLSIVGDPAAALADLVELVAVSTKPLPAPRSDEAAVAHGGRLTEQQVWDILAEVRPEGAQFVWDAPSTMGWWNRVPINEPSSYFAPGAGTVGFGLPAAIGVSLARPYRHTIALLGDGAINYTIAALWTAAQRELDCTFIVLRNGTYQVLEDYGAMLGAQLPDMKLRDLDFVSISRGYGVRADRVDNADALSKALRNAFAEPGPHLIEVSVMALSSGMF